jgi:hypothetical protein
VIATNHSEFDDVLGRLSGDALLVDPWNTTGAGRVFARVNELARVE